MNTDSNSSSLNTDPSRTQTTESDYLGGCSAPLERLTSHRLPMPLISLDDLEETIKLDYELYFDELMPTESKEVTEKLAMVAMQALFRPLLFSYRGNCNNIWGRVGNNFHICISLMKANWTLFSNVDELKDFYNKLRPFVMVYVNVRIDELNREFIASQETASNFQCNTANQEANKVKSELCLQDTVTAINLIHQAGERWRELIYCLCRVFKDRTHTIQREIANGTVNNSNQMFQMAVIPEFDDLFSEEMRYIAAIKRQIGYIAHTINVHKNNYIYRDLIINFNYLTVISSGIIEELRKDNSKDCIRTIKFSASKPQNKKRGSAFHVCFELIKEQGSELTEQQDVTKEAQKKVCNYINMTLKGLPKGFLDPQRVQGNTAIEATIAENEQQLKKALETVQKAKKIEKEEKAQKRKKNQREYERLRRKNKRKIKAKEAENAENEQKRREAEEQQDQERLQKKRMEEERLQKKRMEEERLKKKRMEEGIGLKRKHIDEDAINHQEIEKKKQRLFHPETASEPQSCNTEKRFLHPETASEPQSCNTESIVKKLEVMFPTAEEYKDNSNKLAGSIFKGSQTPSVSLSDFPGPHFLFRKKNDNPNRFCQQKGVSPFI